MPRDRPTPAIKVTTPAKVNLHLSVGERRPDGFHELVTVFHAVNMADTVFALPADELSVHIRGEGARTLPRDDGNIAWRAAQLLADTAGIPAHVELQLVKKIPVAGGMAGGSADAAGVLVACAQLWGLDVGPTELTALAAQLGSDVPFPLLGGTALGTGRGEVLTPVPSAGKLIWTFAAFDFGISAGAAYDVLDRRRDMGTAQPPIGPPEKLLAALEAGDPHAVAAHLANDLEPVALALAPQLRATLDAGLRFGALAGIVSGSGPTCAFLCPDIGTSALMSVRLEDEGFCRISRTASGPFHGAQVRT